MALHINSHSPEVGLTYTYLSWEITKLFSTILSWTKTDFCKEFIASIAGDSAFRLKTLNLVYFQEATDSLLNSITCSEHSWYFQWLFRQSETELSINGCPLLQLQS